MLEQQTHGLCLCLYRPAWSQRTAWRQRHRPAATALFKCGSTSCCGTALRAAPTAAGRQPAAVHSTNRPWGASCSSRRSGCRPAWLRRPCPAGQQSAGGAARQADQRTARPAARLTGQDTGGTQEVRGGEGQRVGCATETAFRGGAQLGMGACRTQQGLSDTCRQESTQRSARPSPVVMQRSAADDPPSGDLLTPAGVSDPQQVPAASEL